MWVTPNTKLRDKDIPDEFIKWKAKSYLKSLTTITYTSLHKLEGEWDIIFLDEIQDLTIANSKGFFNNKIHSKRIIGLTGTLPEHAEKLDIYKRLKLQVLQELTIDEAVDKGILADYTINIVECQMNNKDKNIDAGNKKNKFKVTEYQQYEYLDKRVRQAMFSIPKNDKLLKWAILNRMRGIYDSKTKEEVTLNLVKCLKGRKVIFAASIQQAEKISKYTYHSKTDDTYLNEFQNGNIDTLACVDAGGIGFTFKNVDHFIINKINSNKKGDITQKISRSLLRQKNYEANIWITCLLNTKDEDWVKSALKKFNPKKINYINEKNLRL